MADIARWQGSAGLQAGTSAPRNRRDLSGLHALRDDRAGKHRRRSRGE